MVIIQNVSYETVLRGLRVMTTQERTIICGSFLFHGVAENTISEYLKYDGVCERIYPRGAVIIAEGVPNKKLSIMLCGNATVYKTIADKPVPVNVLHAGDIMGVSTLLCEDAEEAVTCVKAHTQCKVLEIEEHTLGIMLSNDLLLKNYIGYLVKRIHFLADRMQNFAQCSTEAKLLSFIVSNAANGVFHVQRSYAYLAETLSMGRASLYRALDKLESTGHIQRNGKLITVLSR